tara:strand:+ start:111 stop:548 length:438 start_codon:yes stop_codon:yes gene_type:complete
MKEKYSRKILLVNPKFQFSFMKHSILMTVAALATFYLFKVYMFWELKDIALSTGISPDHDFISLIDNRNYVIDMSFVVLAIVVGFLMTGWALWVSHKVAGPIHRIRNEIKKIIDGQPLQRINVRDHDYFHDLKDSVNLLIEYFRR